MTLTTQTLEQEKTNQQQQVGIDSSDLFHAPRFHTILPRTVDQFMKPPTWDTQMVLYDSRHHDQHTRSMITFPSPLRIHQLHLRHGTFYIPTVSDQDPPLLLYESHAQIAALQSPYMIHITPGYYGSLHQLAASLQTAIQRSGAKSHYQVVATTPTQLTITSDRTGGNQLFILTVPEQWNSRLGTLEPDSFGTTYRSTHPCHFVHEWVYLFQSRDTVFLSSLVMQVYPVGNGWYMTTNVLENPSDKIQKNTKPSIVRSSSDLPQYPNGVLSFSPSILTKSLPLDVQTIHHQAIHHMTLLFSMIVDRQLYQP